MCSAVFCAVVWLVGICVWWLLRPAPAAKAKRQVEIDENLDSHRLDRALKGTKTSKRYLVIGAGQVGLRICEVLVARGEEHVSAFDISPPRRRYRVPGAENIVKFVQGDVTSEEDVSRACKGVDVVFLTAALIRYYERMPFQYPISHKVNVMGTENVIQACIKNSVTALIQTSTSNVCVAKENVANFPIMDEHTPYCSANTSPNHYGWTKVQAEKKILSADGSNVASGDKLATAALRPCSGVFGPDDGFMLQKSLEDSNCTMIFTKPVIDFIFIDNLVLAHLLLEKELHKVHGHVFCVSNNEPESLEQLNLMAQSVLKAKKMPEMTITYAPQGLMVVLAYIVEQLQWLTGNKLIGEIAFLTPAMMNLACLSYTFDCKKAASLLNYKPLYNLDEAISLTVDTWAADKKRN